MAVDVRRYDVVALTYIVRYHIVDEVRGRSFGGFSSNMKRGCDLGETRSEMVMYQKKATSLQPNILPMPVIRQGTESLLIQIVELQRSDSPIHVFNLPSHLHDSL